MIGASGRDYVVWDGFKVDDYYAVSTPDTGPTVLSDCRHCQIINCEIIGVSTNIANHWGIARWGDNYNGLRLEDAFYCRVANNKIHGFRPGVWGVNEAGIMMYDSPWNVIENNTIYDCGSGIFVKGIHADAIPLGGQTGNVLRRNLIHGCLHIAIWHNDGIANQIYQNVIHSGAARGLLLGGAAAYNNTRDSVFANNTIHAAHSGFELSQVVNESYPLNAQFIGNIVSSPTWAAIYDWNRGVPDYLPAMTFDRNLYFNAPIHWRSDSSGGVTYSAWVSTYGRDPNSVNGQDPLFLSATGGDFRLQAGSPAHGLSRDVLNISGQGVNVAIPAGAYLTGNEQIGASW